MFNFLRRLFRNNLRDAPHPPDNPHAAHPLQEDLEMERRCDQLEREALAALRQERAAEQLLPPRERIKNRLNLPTELSAESRAKESVPVLSPPRNPKGVSMVVVVNRVGIGIGMPQVLFEYLYGHRSLTSDDWDVINHYLLECGLEPI
jgi:hypothetical protein